MVTSEKRDAEAGSGFTVQVPVGNDDDNALRSALALAASWTSAHPSERAGVVLAPGVHRIDPVDDAVYALTIERAARIDVIGFGATVLFTDPRIGGFHLVETDSVVLRGFTVDWLTPSFTQGVITRVDARSGELHFTPAPSFPDFRDRTLFTGAGYGTLRDPSTGRLKPDVRQTYLLTHGSEPDDDGAFRVLLDQEGRESIGDIDVGDGFVIGHRGERHGIALSHCADTVLDHVTLHAAPCAGVISHESSGTRLDGVVVARRPGSGRWISTNADAFHCQGGRIGPVISDCTFEGMHDDGINLYVHAMTVATDAAGDRVLLTSSAEVRPGDELQFVDGDSGTVLLETVALDAERTSSDRIAVRIRDAAAMPEGTEVYNRSNSSSGFAILRCTFSDFRGVGVRLKASDGEISGCTFRSLSGYGLWVANDPGWSEGPLGSHDVEIRDNTFVDSPADRALRHWPHSAATVMIESFDRRMGPGASVVHERLRIVGNRIQQVAEAAVFIGAADDVVVEALEIDPGQPPATGMPVRRREAAGHPVHRARPSNSRERARTAPGA